MPVKPAAVEPVSAARVQSAAAEVVLPAVNAALKPSAPDPAVVEAVVQRVLDKMRPQVVEIITKEFLRPIIQALVHREMGKH
ncbi:MAG: hypothetical protein ACRD4Y_09005 [Candidatus Acidiferrales bacterium]